MLIQIFLGIVISLAVSPVQIECLDARITSWIQSTGYGYGAFSGYRADVMQIYYTMNKVFVNANSIPSYSIGPWTKNPNNASAQNYITSFPMSPSAATTKTATALGVNGLYTNGVAIFNGWDGTYYNNTVWQQNAYVYEGVSFDSCNGHPSGKSVYHNHVNPVCLYDSTDSSSHSPIIGWMFDGYPLYGPFGYSSANDSSSSIKRILPSYSLRTYANNQRTSLANGTVLSAANYGPNVNSTYPVGNYIQDYEYVSGSGDLDEYNGRWCVTPDYPSGTYAYFIATNSSGLPTYPYTIGPYYYGTVSSTSTSQNIPSAATKYFSIY